jgi:hypothetical protein
MNTKGLAHPKGKTKRQLKARKDRQEARVKRSVRAEVAKADGFCRLSEIEDHICSGRSEWAHLGDKKRARTRKQTPEVRHTTAGTLMLCTPAHRAYDDGLWRIEPQDKAAGANGVLHVTFANGWTARVSARPLPFVVLQ